MEMFLHQELQILDFYDALVLEPPFKNAKHLCTMFSGIC